MNIVRAYPISEENKDRINRIIVDKVGKLTKEERLSILVDGGDFVGEASRVVDEISQEVVKVLLEIGYKPVGKKLLYDMDMCRVQLLEEPGNVEDGCVVVRVKFSEGLMR